MASKFGKHTKGGTQVHTNTGSRGSHSTAYSVESKDRINRIISREIILSNKLDEDQHLEM